MEKLISFVKKYSEAPFALLIFFVVLSGAIYPFLLYIINLAEKNIAIDDNTFDIRLFAIYLILLGLLLYSKTFSMNRLIAASQQIIRKIRVAIIGKIRQTELSFVEKIGFGLLYTRLTTDTETLSRSAPILIMSMENVFSLIALFFYVMSQSFSGFILIIALLGLSFLVYRSAFASAKQKIRLSRIKEATFFNHLNDVIYGFKEIRINYQKNEELFTDINLISQESKELKVDAQDSLNTCFIILNASYFIIIGTIIFIFPIYKVVDNSLIIILVSALLFLWGPVMIIFRSVLQLMLSSVSVDNLIDLESLLDDFIKDRPDISTRPMSDFNEIKLKSVKYCYTNQQGKSSFEMGPLDFALRKGEIVFVVGGNGTGKSTFMKIMTGLYFPEKNGKITIDGKILTPGAYQSYRELFSTIFTDFRLFEKLYGLKDVDINKVFNLLKQMQLAHKTQYDRGKFTHIELSSGQKKRLAYVTCLLEDKPIYVFDEWAADQDPAFRKKFYENFLDDMRAMNKTVIAVSHDDRYFDKADRVVKMEDGRFVPYEPSIL